jgi:predicted CXXCH cytochrome family protein
MSRIGILAVIAAVLGAPLVATAAEAPHDATMGYSCANCHVAHQSLGTGLTKNNSNSVLCDSCHKDYAGFGFSWPSSLQAQAGVAGSSHSWSALASNLGATPPDPSSANTLVKAMGGHLDTGGKLKCTTCHDTHNADGNGGTLHISVTLGATLTKTVTVGAGTLALTKVPAGARAFGYVIKASAANQFKISHDNGKTYLGYYPTNQTWDLETKPNYGTGKTFTSAAVTLDDGLTEVTFTGTPGVGDTWQKFYVSYPFLRGDGPTMCVTCHKDRDQTWRNVEGLDNLAGTGQAITLGQTYFSHPVKQGMNANSKNYDRATILDADGSLQGAGETNPTNDLVLNAAGNVTCMTCHHPHNADSNSLTVDPR